MITTHFRKSLLTATLLTAALTASDAYSKESRGDRDCNRYHSSKHEDGHRGKGLERKSLLEREFSADQIRTLTEARLILKGNPNLKVGEIDSHAEGYTIRIVTRENSLVEERKVAKNGMPWEKFERLQQRLQEKAARQEARQS